MPVTWFQSQQAAEAPIAPLSSQQAAARWEPSVQDFVTEIGGYTIDELQQFMQSRWRTSFEIEKVWKATDAISDRGIHSYLQHHWVIIRLIPAQQNREAHLAEASSTGCAESANEASETSGALRVASGPSGEGQGRSSAQHSDDPDNVSGFPRGDLKRQKIAASHEPSGSAKHPHAQDSQQPGNDQYKTICNQEMKSGSEGNQPVTKLSTELPLDAALSREFQPVKDYGMQLADQGKPWFLRIDRFNEADKWFACGTFENAMQSEQARTKHFSPSSEITFEGQQGVPLLPLECMLPSLLRLAVVKYSVFAKGNHCQWHARVVTTLIASLAYFMAPIGNSMPRCGKVSHILVYGKEQQRYAAMAGKFGGPDNSYLRAFPEAPYLKPAILDLKDYCQQTADKALCHVAKKAFPDLQLVYASMTS